MFCMFVLCYDSISVPGVAMVWGGVFFFHSNSLFLGWWVRGGLRTVPHFLFAFLGGRLRDDYWNSGTFHGRHVLLSVAARDGVLTPLELPHRRFQAQGTWKLWSVKKTCSSRTSSFLFFRQNTARSVLFVFYNFCGSRAISFFQDSLRVELVLDNFCGSCTSFFFF